MLRRHPNLLHTSAPERLASRWYDASSYWLPCSSSVLRCQSSKAPGLLSVTTHTYRCPFCPSPDHYHLFLELGVEPLWFASIFPFLLSLSPLFSYTLGRLSRLAVLFSRAVAPASVLTFIWHPVPQANDAAKKRVKANAAALASMRIFLAVANVRRLVSGRHGVPVWTLRCGRFCCNGHATLKAQC